MHHWVFSHWHIWSGKFNKEGELFFHERRDLCVQELSAVSGEIQYSIEIEYSIPRIMEAQFGGLNWKAGVWDLDGLPGSVFITQSSWWSIAYQDNRFSANRTINIHVFIEILFRLSTSFVLVLKGWFQWLDINKEKKFKKIPNSFQEGVIRCIIWQVSYTYQVSYLMKLKITLLLQ